MHAKKYHILQHQSQDHMDFGSSLVAGKCTSKHRGSLVVDLHRKFVEIIVNLVLCDVAAMYGGFPLIKLWDIKCACSLTLNMIKI